MSVAAPQTNLGNTAAPQTNLGNTAAPQTNLGNTAAPQQVVIEQPGAPRLNKENFWRHQTTVKGLAVSVFSSF